MKERIQSIRDRWNSESKGHRYTLVAIFLAGLGLRIAYLFQPIRYDEAFTHIVFASAPLLKGLAYYPYPNNHLLNTFFIHFSEKVFGANFFAIRLPAFLAGILLIPATYLVMRKTFNKWAALLASGLVSVSPLLISFSTDGRGYTIQALIVMVLLWFALEWKEKGARWLRIAVIAITAALGFYAIPTMLYFFGAIAAWLFLSALVGDTSEKRWPFVGKLAVVCAGTAGLTALMYWPVINWTGLDSIIHNTDVQAYPFGTFIGTMPQKIADLWASWSFGIPTVVAMLILLGFVISIVVHKRISKNRVNLSLVIIAVCVIAVFVQRRAPYTRVWIPLLPIYLGYASAGLYEAHREAVGYIEKRREREFVSGKTVYSVIVILMVAAITVSLIVTGACYQVSDLGEKNHEYVFKDAEKVVMELEDEIGGNDVICVGLDADSFYQYEMEMRRIPVEHLIPRLSKQTSELPGGEPDRYYVVACDIENHFLVYALEIAKSAGLDEHEKRLVESYEIGNAAILVFE